MLVLLEVPHDGSGLIRQRAFLQCLLVKEHLRVHLFRVVEELHVLIRNGVVAFDRSHFRLSHDLLEVFGDLGARQHDGVSTSLHGRLRDLKHAEAALDLLAKQVHRLLIVLKVGVFRDHGHILEIMLLSFHLFVVVSTVTARASTIVFILLDCNRSDHL